MSKTPYKQSGEPDRNLTISGLYPALTQEQQADAEYRLLKYLDVVKHIFERICRENPRLLTELERRATLRKKGNLKAKR